MKENAKSSTTSLTSLLETDFKSPELKGPGSVKEDLGSLIPPSTGAVKKGKGGEGEDGEGDDADDDDLAAKAITQLKVRPCGCVCVCVCAGVCVYALIFCFFV